MRFPDFSCLTREGKDALIRALRGQVQAPTTQVQTMVARVAELEARLGTPPKTPDNSSVPPSQGKKSHRAEGTAPWPTVVTRVERCAGCFRRCGATTLAPVPEGLEWRRRRPRGAGRASAGALGV